jgi:hypothetical protein
MGAGEHGRRPTGLLAGHIFSGELDQTATAIALGPVRSAIKCPIWALDRDPLLRIFELWRCCLPPARRDHCRVIRAEEEVAEGQSPAVSDPALRQMVRPIVQHMAALTERAQIP